MKTLQMYSFIFSPVFVLFGSIIFAVTFPTPHPISIALLLFGITSLGYLVISLNMGSKKFKMSLKTWMLLKDLRGKKEVVVLVQSSNTQLLGEIYNEVVELTITLKRVLGLRQVSVLRGDLDFCREALLRKRDYAAIVVLEENIYAQKKHTQPLFKNGAAALYKHMGDTPEELVKSIENSVTHLFTGKMK